MREDKSAMDLYMNKANAGGGEVPGGMRANGGGGGGNNYSVKIRNYIPTKWVIVASIYLFLSTVLGYGMDIAP